MVELESGKIIYNARNNWASKAPEVKPYRFVSSSKDGGETWSPVGYDTALEGMSCQGGLASTQVLSSTMFFSHPTGPARTNMTIRRSTDGGASWPASLHVHAGGSAYSCLAPIAGGKLGLLFERDGDATTKCTSGSSCQVVFVAFPEDF